MRTFAVLSLFTLAPAVAFTLAPASVRAQQVEPPHEVALAEPTQMPDPYLPPDPYDTAADPSQIDWPQDLAAEEPAVDSYDDGYDPQAYTDFQDELAPYGNWIDDASYGRVWAPEASLVGADFTPYDTGGHWVLTEFGWTWVSDWSWGWAPFHYGRWIVVTGSGWCWVPGTIWGPAWVAWRAGDGYVGWAPLPPRGVSVSVTYGRHSGWRFSRAADLAAARPRCIPARDTRGMFHRTLMVTNDRVLTRGSTTVHINAGPRHVPGAVPARLTAIAPRAFPQRAILPHRGATMSARPWIRAEAAGGIPAGRPSPLRAPLSPSSPSAPRAYNPPRPVAPVGYAGQPAFASGAPRIYNPPAASSAPRVFDHQPTYGAPARFGAASPARVYNPPPRTFPSSPAVNPQRTLAPSFHQAYTAPTFHTPSVVHLPPAARSFSAPASPGWSGHAPGGGAHFGGGHRR